MKQRMMKTKMRANCKNIIILSQKLTNITEILTRIILIINSKNKIKFNMKKNRKIKISKKAIMKINFQIMLT